MPNSDIQGLNSGKHHSKTTGSLSETVETMGENQGPQTRNERQRKTAKEQTTANQQNDKHQHLVSKLSLGPNPPYPSRRAEANNFTHK